MKAREIRKKYISFFKTKEHKEIKSAPLIPENDPTILFTTAGMHPLVPYLQGEAHPLGKRLVNCQKCIRTGDIDEVGDEVHLTFFEMLGNWSLGDYFKKEAIEMSFEFLTSEKYLNIPLEKLAFSVFGGDSDAAFDNEAYQHWIDLGVSEKRIAKLSKSDNWWGPAGQTGPCGPDTEMFLWNGKGKAPEEFDPENSNWVEIWNDVFMQYEKLSDGSFRTLNQKNVDTGMGLERVSAILQGKNSCYETDLFLAIFKKLDELGNKTFSSSGKRSSDERIIADHMRAAVFIMADGITPGNEDQPYILRRLIRRAVRKARNIGLKNCFTEEVGQTIIDTYAGVYPELEKKRSLILEELSREEEQFGRTIEKGTKEFEKLIEKVPDFIEKKVFSGKKAFFLYETYGFPIELTEEMAVERGFKLDRKGFDKAYKKHQEMSRKGAEKKFKGGLADHSKETAKLHTATHLLHQALRMILGDSVEQKGSNITAERLRFDFSYPEKMTAEQKAEVEKIVNKQIQKNLPVKCDEMSFEEAKKSGAIGLFEDRYGELVKVYSVGDFSREVCGGPHVSETGELGGFKIKKEKSSSRGVRRIKAVLNLNP